MTSPLDLAMGGLAQASGLSLVTGGLLVLREFTPVPAAGGVLPPPKVDVRLTFDASTLAADAILTSGDLVEETSLQTALLLSLFTDARASAEQLERFGGDQPRGWWGDAHSKIDGDQFGSLLWLLEREVDTTETLNRAREFASQAVAWIVDQGLAASVDVEAEYLSAGVLALRVSPQRAALPRERFAFVWEP